MYRTILRQLEDETRKYQLMVDTITSGASLQERLTRQVRMSDLPKELHPIAEVRDGC